jgi:hypothetical protein
MKILVAGGTGLIGTNLVLHLAGQGHQVTVLTRSPDQQTPFPESVALAGWDAATPEGWLQELESAQAVINLAGENIAGSGFFPEPWTPARRKSILESRLNVGRALLSGFERADRKPEILIQASAIGIYGSHPGSQKLTEISPSGSGFLAEVCRAWEDSTQPVEVLGVRRAVCRLGIVLDPKGGALQRMLLPFKLYAGGPFGTGKQWYSWIHTDDVSRGLQFLLETPGCSGVYNFTSPEPVPNRKFAEVLGRVLNRPSWLPVPGFALRILFGDVSTVVLEGQRVLPSKLLDSRFQFAYPALEPALRDLLD